MGADICEQSIKDSIKKIRENADGISFIDPNGNSLYLIANILAEIAICLGKICDGIERKA